MRIRLIFAAGLAYGCVAQPLEPIRTGAPSPVSDARMKAVAASARLLDALRGVEGCYGVKSARVHDGTELIFAWFENRAAVMRWFEHDYHRKLLRDAGRTEDHRAAEHFGDDVGPILVIASVAYPAARGSIHASMFDDPVAGRPSRFAIEYYTPLSGGAYMVEPFAPPAVIAQNDGVRDVFADDER